MQKNKQILLIYLFLTITTLSAFRRLTQCDFINYDDPSYVTENVHIKNGVTFDAIRWAFTSAYASNWHPITWMSHILDVQLFGLNPHLHHSTNLLFHIANTLLLFFVFNRMTKAPWKSAFVAALFALHPLHVESVAWIAERKDVLSTLFWMITIAAYIYYVERRTEEGGQRTEDRLRRPHFLFPFSDFRYLAVVVLFALGLMAKPMLVTLPFVLLLLDLWPLSRVDLQMPFAASQLRVKKIFLEKIPLFALAALSCIVTYIAQRKGGAVRSSDAFPMYARIANALVSYVLYIKKAIWPNDLAVLYPHPGTRPLWQVCGAALFLGALTFIVVRKTKTHPFLPVGWLWFAGTLVPVLGIVQVGWQAMADRYTYIPLIGLFIIAAWGVPELFQGWRLRSEALYALASIVLLFLCIGASMQVGYWRESLSLYNHALKVTADNDIIRHNLGDAYSRLGDYGRSIPEFNRAIEMNPGKADVYNKRGVAFAALGDYGKAIRDFDRAVRIDPENAMAFTNRGSAYTRLGNQRHAIDDFNRAIEIDPKATWAYNGRAIAYSSSGDRSRALEDLLKAVKIDPDCVEARFNLGNAYEKTGDHSQALGEFETAIKLNPRYAAAYVNRGLLYDTLGDHTKAIEDFSKAIEINPGDWRAYYNRSAAHAELGHDSQATEDLRSAEKLRPGNAAGP
ncbi:MAG TPA: tetratricopeptide repeat protein [Syntrophobacteraceae bacterium]|nr:tetratricopeptide repeat protein [Syntrophobacteraceae bacterium]